MDVFSSYAVDLGPAVVVVGMLGILFRQLATGRLVFKKQLDELRADKDAEMARTVEYYDKLIELKEQQAESWHRAYVNESAVRQAQGGSLGLRSVPTRGRNEDEG